MSVDPFPIRPITPTTGGFPPPVGDSGMLHSAEDAVAAVEQCRIDALLAGDVATLD